MNLLTRSIVDMRLDELKNPQIDEPEFVIKREYMIGFYCALYLEKVITEPEHDDYVRKVMAIKCSLVAKN